MELGGDHGIQIHTKEIVQTEDEVHPFGRYEPIINLPKDKIVPDDNFPKIETKVDLSIFALQVVDSTVLTTEKKMLATNRSGRQLFTEPSQEIRADDQVFPTIMVKSTGVPKIVRQSWHEYKSQDEPFFFTTKNKNADNPEGLVAKSEFMGLALKEDQRLDAKNSITLRKFGVKVRIPLGGWSVSEFQVGGEQRSIDWFKSEGYEGDELFQSAWGMICPLRLDDINDRLAEAVTNQTPDKLDPLLHELIKLAKQDQSQEYQGLVRKWGSVEDQISPEQRIELLIDFGKALSRTMGKNFNALQQAGLSHGNLHDGNITFFGELCDCSTVKEGQLNSGGPQKVGDDIDSFAETMERYVYKILQLQGVDTFKESQRARDLTGELLLQVREGWGGYEKWVNDYINSLVSGDQRDSVRKDLAETYGEDGVTEARITEKILHDLGGIDRFRVYG